MVYIVELQERLDLRAVPGVQGRTNPKSSTGRLDILTRVICETGEAFDTIGPDYHGPLYAEIAPRSFSVKVKQGTSLSQLRLRKGLSHSRR